MCFSLFNNVSVIKLIKRYIKNVIFYFDHSINVTRVLFKMIFIPFSKTNYNIAALRVPFKAVTVRILKKFVNSEQSTSGNCQLRMRGKFIVFSLTKIVITSWDLICSISLKFSFRLSGLLCSISAATYDSKHIVY